jgi:hypothetical protein
VPAVCWLVLRLVFACAGGRASTCSALSDKGLHDMHTVK